MTKKEIEYTIGYRLKQAKKSLERKLSEYSETVIDVPAERRWDYAIPENYTNYHEGFLFQDGEITRGMPIVNYNGEILYLERALSFTEREPDENEKLLLFDRSGRKYTFIVRNPVDYDSPNPSYIEFLSKVKPYKSMKRPKLAI